MSLRRFAPADADGFRAFLSATPRALVLFAGDACAYSATFRPHFERAAAEGSAWTFAVRELSEASESGWDAHAIRVTPTLVAFEDGKETARLEGRMLLGVTRPAFRRWLAALPS